MDYRTRFSREETCLQAVVGGCVLVLGLSLLVLLATTLSVWLVAEDEVTPEVAHVFGSFKFLSFGYVVWVLWSVVAVAARPRVWWVWAHLVVAVLVTFWVVTHPMWAVDLSFWLLGKRMVREGW